MGKKTIVSFLAISTLCFGAFAENNYAVGESAAFDLCLRDVDSALLNSAVVHDGGELAANETWAAGSVHVVYGTVVVATNATLTIEPGAVVKFLGGGIIARGNCIAKGVTFTDIADGATGGALPMPSYVLKGNIETDDATRIRFAKNGDEFAVEGASETFAFSLRTDAEIPAGAVEHGGGELAADETWAVGSVHVVYGTVVVATNATLTIEPGATVKFLGGGIIARGNCIAKGATFTDIADGGALPMPSYTLRGNFETDDATCIRFAKNGDEFAAEGASETFAFSLRTDAEIPAGAVEHGGGELAADETWAAGSVHVVHGTVVVATNATLTIEPGATVKFFGGGIIARGNCIAKGATFTDIADGATGGALPMPSYTLRGNFETDDATRIRFAKNGDEFAAEGASGAVRIDIADDEFRFAHEEESIAYSSEWANGEDVSVTVTGPDGGIETLVNESGPAAGIAPWTKPTVPGLYEFRHESGGETLTAKFAVVDGVAHDGAIDEDETWEKGRVHIVGRNLNVRTGSTLTIEPGAVVKFLDGKTLTVEPGGACIAEGVVFTSIHDDTAGGDSFNDGDTAQPAENGYAIVGFVQDDLATEYRYGVQSYSGTLAGEAVWRKEKTYVIDGTLTVASGASLTIPPGTVVKFTEGGAIKVAEGGVCVAEGAIFTHIADDSVGGDTMGDGDKTKPAYGAYAVDVAVLDSDETEYRYSAPIATSGTISGNVVWRARQVYHVTGNLTLASGATLTIAPGSIVKFDPDVSFTVNGGATLNAQGTRALPVVFTSIKDDAHGGDTNGDGDATVPNPGDWVKICVNGGTANFNYAKILYSSKNATTGAINMTGNGGTTVFANGEIAHAAYDAIGVESGRCHVSNSVIHDCLLAFRHWTKDPIVNCVIYDCGRLTQGGGQHFYNCIFSRITETWEAFGFPQNGTTYNNCCFWNEGGSVLTGEGAQDAMTVCGKNGNIWGDPMFIDPENGDFRIAADSPCVDAGDATIAPAKDWYGQPRYAIHGLEPTGIPDADGAYADIGIHEIQPRDAGSDIDLEVRSVSLSGSSFAVGGTIVVSWRVANIGSANPEKSWRDKVEIVDSSGIPVELGIVHVRGIPAGGEETFSKSFVVPAVAEGPCHVRVTANCARDIYEGSLTTNNACESEKCRVSLAVLEFSESGKASVDVLPGQRLSMAAENLPSAGGAMLIRAGGNVNAYLSFDASPTCHLHDSASVVLPSGDLLVSIPPREGAAYILLEAGAGESPFTVDIDIDDAYPAIYGISKSMMPKQGSQTLTVYGAGLDEVATVSLESESCGISGRSARVLSACELTASFVLDDAPAGSYWAVVRTADGREAVSPALVSIVPSPDAKADLRIVLEAPDRIRDGRWYEAVARIYNAGDADAIAPIAVLNGEGLEFKDPDGSGAVYSGVIQLLGLGTGGDPLSIPPGGEVRLQVAYRSVSTASKGEIRYGLLNPQDAAWTSFISKGTLSDTESDTEWEDALAAYSDGFESPSAFLDAVYEKAASCIVAGVVPRNAFRMYGIVQDEKSGGAASGAVRGVVRSPDGSPAAGAAVVVASAGAAETVRGTTAPDGSFAVYGVAPGALAFTSGDRPLYPAGDAVDLQPGGSVFVELAAEISGESEADNPFLAGSRTEINCLEMLGCGEFNGVWKDGKSRLRLGSVLSPDASLVLGDGGAAGEFFAAESGDGTVFVAGMYQSGNGRRLAISAFAASQGGMRHLKTVWGGEEIRGIVSLAAVDGNAVDVLTVQGGGADGARRHVRRTFDFGNLDKTASSKTAYSPKLLLAAGSGDVEGMDLSINDNWLLGIDIKKLGLGFSWEPRSDTGMVSAGDCKWTRSAEQLFACGASAGVFVNGQGSGKEEWSYICQKAMGLGGSCAMDDACLTAHLLRRSGRCQGGAELPIEINTESLIKKFKGTAYAIARHIPLNFKVSANISVTAGSDYELRERVIPKKGGGHDSYITEDQSYGLKVGVHGGASVNLGLPQLQGGEGRAKREWSVTTSGNSDIPLEAHGNVDIEIQRDVKIRNGKFQSTSLHGGGTLDVRVGSLGCTASLVNDGDGEGFYWKWSYFDLFDREEKSGDTKSKNAFRAGKILASPSGNADAIFPDEISGEWLTLAAWNVRETSLGGDAVHVGCREYVSGRTVRKGLYVRDGSTGAETRIGDDSHDVERFEAAVLADGSTAIYYLASEPDFSGGAESLFESYFRKRLYKISWRDGLWSAPEAVVSDPVRAQSGIALAVSGSGAALVAFRDSDALSSDVPSDSLMAFIDDGASRGPSQVVMNVGGREIPSVAACFKAGEPRIVAVENIDGADFVFVKRFADGKWTGPDVPSKQTTRKALASATAVRTETFSRKLSTSSGSSCGGNCGKGCHCGCRGGGEPSNGCACPITCACKGLCSPGQCKCWKDKKNYDKPKSEDPNEMAGPAGEGARRCVKRGDWMDYTIYFENKTNATAAAQDVYVTLPKDAGLDWSTFELGEIVFGDNVDSGLSGFASGESSYAVPGTNWSVRTEVAHEDGAVKWHLRIVDPSTFDNYPTDPYDGFLPPNDETGRGEGHLRYRVRVRDDAEPGSVVNASATIVFDTNAPIETDPAWWNTVTPVDRFLKAGEYVKLTLAELGYDVPTDGTPYSVVAKGLPAGLKLVSNKAETKKVKGKTVVVKAAKSEWWIEGVPTAAVDFFTNPPYLVITANGETMTEALPVEVAAQEVTELEDLALGQSINTNGWLSGVGAGWTVSGLPTGLKYATKKVTKKVKSGKRTVTQTVAEAYAVYGKTTKAGLFNITAKKKKGAYYETLKYRVLVRPKAMDTAVFGETLTNITTMAYVPVAWDLRGDDGGRAGRVTLPVVENVVKVAGLPAGVAFAAKDTYKDKKKTVVKQYGQTIVGKPTKPGTYVVTFTKNVREKVNGKMKTVAKTAQILWTVEPNDAELELGFNTAGGVVESGVVGLKYDGLMAFTATSNATVTASGLPAGIKLVRLEDGRAGRATLPGEAVWGFEGFTAKAGTYLVTVKATLNGKSVTQRVALVVEALPAWAKGTFNGYVSGEGGLATITVSAAGKISGKFYEDGTNWTVSAASYTAAEAGTRDACPYQAFVCSNVVAKYSYKAKEKDKKGKLKTVTKTITREFALTVVPVPVVPDVADVPIRGVVSMVEGGGLVETALPGTVVMAWQNLWGGAYKAVGKKIFTSKSGNKTLAYKTFTIKATSEDGAGTGGGDGDDGRAGRATLPGGTTLTLKVTTAGAVTATLTYDTGKKKNKKTIYYKPACSTVVIPVTAPDAEEFAGEVPLYFAPSAANNFPGWSGNKFVP